MGPLLVNLLETFVFGLAVLFFIGFLVYTLTLFFITQVKTF